MYREFENKLKCYAEFVTADIEDYLQLNDSDYNVLYESMRYSSLAGGKRIRAFLALEFFSVFSKVNPEKTPEIVLPVAAAIEMIHTYSLIHDDLPCMDNDDLRRGQPSNHKKFGEATALLAGDALLTFAFNIIANAKFLTDSQKVKIISEVSKAAGHSGMIGGQVMDMIYENKKIDVIRLVKMHSLKTGNMIIVSARTGCIAGGATDDETNAAAEYAKNIGLAYQVIDDILDRTGSKSRLGKKPRSDIKNGKNTFVNIFGGEKPDDPENTENTENPENIAEAFEYARKLTDEAVLSLEELKKINNNIDVKNLEILAEYLLERKN